jgi:nicotinic acid mononucleotide adenylyltransferase
MNDTYENVALLLKCNARVHIAASGAGAGIQQAIWEVPGCSSFFVGAAFPYATEEVDAFLGFKPDRYASAETALDFAMAAYMHAANASDGEPIGVGLVASVASLVEHRGDHRVHVAVMTKDRVLARDITLHKGSGASNRAIDGGIADRAGLQALFVAAGISPNTDELFVDRTKEARQRFFLRPHFIASGERIAEPPQEPGSGFGRTFFPGTFNPPHEGHFAMARAAKGNVLFSITVDPPHKDPVSLGEMCRRAKLLEGHDRLFSQGDALYLDKAKRYPGASFLIGADAAIRMFDPKWTADSAALAWELVQHAVTFYVAPRRNEAGLVKDVSDVRKLVPGSCAYIFRSLPSGIQDVSSSAIRASAEAR